MLRDDVMATRKLEFENSISLHTKFIPWDITLRLYVKLELSRIALHTWYAHLLYLNAMMLIRVQGESEHKRAKCFYAFTNKRNVEGQIAEQEARTCFAHEISGSSSNDAQPKLQGDEDSKAPIDLHHHMPDSQKHHIDI